MLVDYSDSESESKNQTNTSGPSNADAPPPGATESAAFSNAPDSTDPIPIPGGALSKASADAVFKDILGLPLRSDRKQIYDVTRRVYLAAGFDPKCTFTELPEDHVNSVVQELGDLLAEVHPTCQRCSPWLQKWLLFRIHKGRGRRKE